MNNFFNRVFNKRQEFRIGSRPIDSIAGSSSKDKYSDLREQFPQLRGYMLKEDMPNLEKIVFDFEKVFASPRKVNESPTNHGNFVKRMVAALEQKYNGRRDNRPKPQISMGPSTGKQYDPLEELDALESPADVSKSAADTKKPQDKHPEKKASSSGGSWFGGLFSKLTPKPRNQMILPDDDNPTIIWDPVAKKWVNKDDDGDSASSRLAPPPKMSELNLKPSITAEQNLPTPESVVRPPSADSKTPNSSKMISGSGNMFKLQKGRNMRANYIDVMNPGGVKSNGPPSAIPTPAASPLMQPMAASSPQLFVPAPVNDPNAPVDFLTTAPTTIPSGDTTTSQALSRWSSASSLSREVQSYTMRDPRHHQRIKGPMMYNPADVKENPMKNVSRSRYPPR